LNYKKIDAQTEIRASHLKWMQDAQDAIAKVLRQISQTNETVFELTQDISVIQTQVDQINKKIRADILKQNLEDAQAELAKVKDNQDSIAVQKAKLEAQAQVFIDKTSSYVSQLKKHPGPNPEIVAALNDPNDPITT